MTRAEATAYNDNLKKELEEAALKIGLEESIGAHIVDHYITIQPEDARKGMIFLGEDSASYKAGNIKIDLKNAIMAALEYAAALGKPESVFNYIQLIIKSAFFIQKSTKIKLSELEAYAVYLLHQMDAYDTDVEEELFIGEMQGLCQQKGRKNVGQEEIVDTINHLYAIQSIDINGGYIQLKEHVWGTVE